MLEKTLESPLDSKEIKPVNPKGYHPWIFIGRTDAETEALILWHHLMRRADSLKKTLMPGKIEDKRRKGQQRMRRFDSISDSIGFPGGSAGKEFICNAGNLGSIPGLEKFPGEGKATHSSILAWRIPWTIQSMVPRVRYDWATFTHTVTQWIWIGAKSKR